MTTFGMIGSIVVFLGFVLTVIARWDYIQKDPQRRKLAIISLSTIIVGILILVATIVI